jgi:lipoyl(octanoyl) transferase
MVVRPLAAQPLEYLTCLQEMRDYTAGRDPDSPDQAWLVEHWPVFTMGLAGRKEHVHTPGGISVIHTERGGQVTYHGPGQVIMYLMLDLRRRNIGVRDLVQRLERSVIRLLEVHGIQAQGRREAPGVYLGPTERLAGAKIAALGLKVSRGCTFHGLALNVAMDLEPFQRIDPCGFPGQAVTDMQQVLGHPPDRFAIAQQLSEAFLTQWNA